MFRQAAVKHLLPPRFLSTSELSLLHNRESRRSIETSTNFKPTLKILLPQEKIVYPNLGSISRKSDDTLFSNVGENLLEISASIRKYDRKMRLFNSKLIERRIYKLFECAKLPPLPKRPKTKSPVSYGALIKDKKRFSEFSNELAFNITNLYGKSPSSMPEELEKESAIIALYGKMEKACVNSTEFPLLVFRFIIQLLEDKKGDAALSVFQRYVKVIDLHSTESEEGYVEQAATVSIKMAQSLARHFSRDSDVIRISKVYDLFQELGLNGGGKMEYLMAAAHAKESKFYAAQLFLVLSIVEFGHNPHPNELNTLLEYAVSDLPSGRTFANLLRQYMDYKYPPSHIPRPSQNARTFVLKAQLCSTSQELTELIGRADQYRLLTSHLLQVEIIKRGANLLKDNILQNTHILHGWLTRLHRPKTRFVVASSVPEYHNVSPNVEVTCIYAFCKAKCALSATNILTSLLKNHTTLNPVRKTKLFKAVLKTISQYPQAHNLGWKNAIMSWLILHFQPHGEWKVDPALHNLVFQALVSLNELELANAFRQALAPEVFPSDVSSYISILEKGLASPTVTSSPSLN